MGAGELNRLLQFEKRSETVDELNQPVLGDWVAAFPPIWGNIKSPTGMGSIRGSGEAGGLPRDLNLYSIRIRYRNNGTITNGMRIVHLGTRFDIKQVKHDFDRREWTDLICEVGGNND